jgi:putative ABC transport system permease protein
MTTILVTLACLLAVALIYNVGRIALSERGRELASLRVLGFTRGEVAGMLLGEQALLTIAALPLGLVLGYLASALITRAYQWELYRLPMVVSPTTYAAAAAIIMTAAIASGAIVRRRLDRLDLVAVLKTRE